MSFNHAQEREMVCTSQVRTAPAIADAPVSSPGTTTGATEHCVSFIKIYKYINKSGYIRHKYRIYAHLVGNCSQGYRNLGGTESNFRAGTKLVLPEIINTHT